MSASVYGKAIEFGKMIDGLDSSLHKLCHTVTKCVNIIRWRQSLLATLSVKDDRWLVIEEYRDTGWYTGRYDLLYPIDAINGLKHIKSIIADEAEEELEIADQLIDLEREIWGIMCTVCVVVMEPLLNAKSD